MAVITLSQAVSCCLLCLGSVTFCPNMGRSCSKAFTAEGLTWSKLTIRRIELYCPAPLQTAKEKQTSITASRRAWEGNFPHIISLSSWSVYLYPYPLFLYCWRCSCDWQQCSAGGSCRRSLTHAAQRGSGCEHLRRNILALVLWFIDLLSWKGQQKGACKLHGLLLMSLRSVGGCRIRWPKEGWVCGSF